MQQRERVGRTGIYSAFPETDRTNGLATPQTTPSCGKASPTMIPVKACQKLGWQPTGPSLLSALENMDYSAL